MMSHSLESRSRTGQVAAALAHDLLMRGTGDRLPTLAQYARRFGVGNGSVEKALRILQDHGAVQLEARGHLGTFVIARDAAALWVASGERAITGVVPRPNTFEFEGLAAGLALNFARHEIAFTPLFIPGSRKRIDAMVQGRARFAVLSAVASERACETGSVSIICLLHPGSFYPDASLVILTRNDLTNPNDASRVAIDLGSYDHEALTRAHFGARQYVDVPYDLIPDRLDDHTVDAALWHRRSRSTLIHADRWRLHPVTTPTTVDLLQRMARATIVARADDIAARTILEATIAPELIAAAQTDARPSTQYLPET